MSYVKNLEVDEIRNGFLVNSARKKLWNAQIGLLVEFGRVCEKYGLRWFAAWGTLLGAVRHRGFIPWDDDVDVNMPREDYEKLKLIAPSEFRYPFYFDLWHEHDDPTDEHRDLWFPLVPFSKLRDSRTVMIEFPNRPRMNQGIWIDIFPMDPMPPFDDSPDPQTANQNYMVQSDLFVATCIPKIVNIVLRNPQKYHLKIYPKQFWEISQMSLRQRGKIYEDLISKNDQTSRFVACSSILPDYLNKTNSCERSLWNETIYLPFEEISLPAPKDFDKVLTSLYGDWHDEKITHTHSENHSVDISSEKYFAMLGQSDDGNLKSDSLDQKLNIDEFRDGKLIQTWKKRIWKRQLDLILELQRVCEKLDLKFWAIDQTLFAARKLHGFDPSNDFVTFEMTREDFEKLEFHFPLRLIRNSGGGAY